MNRKLPRHTPRNSHNQAPCRSRYLGPYFPPVAPCLVSPSCSRAPVRLLHPAEFHRQHSVPANWGNRLGGFWHVSDDGCRHRAYAYGLLSFTVEGQQSASIYLIQLHCTNQPIARYTTSNLPRTQKPRNPLSAATSTNAPHQHYTVTCATPSPPYVNPLHFSDAP